MSFGWTQEDLLPILGSKIDSSSRRRKDNLILYQIIFCVCLWAGAWSSLGLYTAFVASSGYSLRGCLSSCGEILRVGCSSLQSNLRTQVMFPYSLCSCSTVWVKGKPFIKNPKPLASHPPTMRPWREYKLGDRHTFSTRTCIVFLEGIQEICMHEYLSHYDANCELVTHIQFHANIKLRKTHRVCSPIRGYHPNLYSFQENTLLNYSDV